MKSWRYRLPVCLLFALLLTAVFGVCARADNEGTCGPNLTWKLLVYIARHDRTLGWRDL